MKLQRPPYILAHPADQAGCGFHRILRPMQIMGRCGVMSGRAETQFVQENILHGLQPDIVVMQRQTEEGQLSIIDMYRRALPNAYFVYEIDDALSAVPDKSWHQPYMTPNVDAKLRTAIAKFDVLTVTTEDLADHMRKVCEPGTKIRVVPNMLGRDDMEVCDQVRKQLKKDNPVTAGGKLRIGWGGGIGHHGDLAILNEVMVALKDEVEWVFLGMDPPVPEGVVKHYLGAATPDRYLVSLASMNIDLMVAPLEDHLFNRCKSNLRLIEAGACSYPVICSTVAPYLTQNPPVFSYCDETDQWVRSIRAFAALSPEKREFHGKRMRDWVLSFYVMDDRAGERLKAWLPDRTEPFVPKLNVKGSGISYVTNSDELKDAFETSNDIIYTRDGTVYQPDVMARFAKSDLDVACGLANDGGPWGFPNPMQFQQLDRQAIESISMAATELKEARMVELAAVSGPVVLMTRKALATIGLPDLTAGLSLEVALMDWSCNARSRGLKIGLNPSCFFGASIPFQPIPGEAEIAQVRLAHRWPQAKNDDAALKTVREEVELRFHKNFYRAIPPQDRSNYAEWAERCDTRGPKNLELAQEWQTNTFGEVYDKAFDTRQYPFDVEDLDPEATWIFLTPKGSEVPDDAFQIILDAIHKNPSAMMFYGDNDYREPTGNRASPDFKPNLDMHMLLARDYVTQALVLHRDYLPEGGTVTEATLFEIVLRDLLSGGALSRKNRSAIAHIPHILATLPSINATDMFKQSTDKLVVVKRLLHDFAIPIDANPHPMLPMLRDLTYLPSDGWPKVSIIVPCKDNMEMLAPCIATILKMTSYPKDKMEVMIVDNGSTRKDMLDYQAKLISTTRDQVRLLSWPHPYNWSALNNWAAERATGEVLVFLNDDTRVVSHNWLEQMVSAAMMESVGAVGARLLYPTGFVQHVGVVSQNGMTGHIHKGLPGGNPGVNAYAIISHEATAVTGACLAVERTKYLAVGGFEESLPHNFNDVAFCINLNRSGFVNVVCAQSELQHFEGVTRNAKGFDASAAEKLQIDGNQFGHLCPDPDLYWNPNLLVTWMHNGQMIAGMDMSNYVFPPQNLPWGLPEMERILVLGPHEGIADEVHDSAAVFTLTVNGYAAMITTPPMQNSGPWDTRKPEIAAKSIKDLGIDKIVVTQLGESLLQTLPWITSLGVPVDYRPVDAESVCPRGDLKPNGHYCDSGYAKGECQGCMEKYSSGHGNVFMPSWLAEWFRFIGKTRNVDFTHLREEKFNDALTFTRPNN